jgi:CheY-like chemotaxis protein
MEVLGRLATPEVRERILNAALEQAAVSEIPEEPSAFASFACGPLRDVVEDVLGEDASGAVIMDLSPAFGSEGPKTSSGVRKRNRASLAAPRRDAPVVLVASSNSAEVDLLTERLKDRAKVIAAFDVFALLSAATRHLTAPLTLLLNDEMPAIRPSTLATLARVLPPGTRVIVWGKAAVEPEQRASSAQVEWVRLGRVEDIHGVADMCIALWTDAPEQAEPETPTDPAPGRRVLIAHDDAVLRARLSRMLSDAGYVPISAPDGFMALERCIDEQPSAVIAGYRMATLDGAQLAALLRTRFGDDAPPVLLVAEDLPEPPAGAMAVIRADAIDQDLLPELAAWIGHG